MTEENVIKLGRTTAIASLLIGLVILVAFYFSSSSELPMIGLTYIFIAVIVNVIVLIYVVIKGVKSERYKRALFRTSSLILVNVPLMVLCSWGGLTLMNTMRITFTNNMEKVLTDINITGCEDHQIDKLDIEESKTLWIESGSDCSIKINYEVNGARGEEMVVSYVTSGMGGKMKHSIDGKDKDIIERNLEFIPPTIFASSI